MTAPWTRGFSAPTAGLRVACALGLWATLVVTPHWCQAQTSGALAESLYQQAKRLITEGDYVRACPKLARSHEADPAGGTILLLAMCYEHLGRTASAWATYNEAAAMARRDGRQDRQARAAERIAALEPVLIHLNLESSPAVRGRPTGFQMLVDGEKLPWTEDAELPIDPGTHVVEARAPGYHAWQQTLTLTQPGASTTVVVPELGALPVEAASPQASSAEPSTPKAGQPRPEAGSRAESGRSPWLWLSAGVGLAAAGAGGVLFWQADKKMREADRRCPDRDACDDREGSKLSKTAYDYALGASAAGVLSALAAGGALYFWLTPESASESPSTSVSVVPGGLAVQARGRF